MNEENQTEETLAIESVAANIEDEELGHSFVEIAEVFFNPEALAKAWAHAKSDRREICGLCYGVVSKNASGSLSVEVRECWPAPFANSAHATVSFSHESWGAALDHLEKLREEQPHTGWRIVGWYHSHPNFGIFLSGTDRDSHEIYFPRPWHIALVIDPRREKDGVFYRVGESRVLKQMPYRYLPDKVDTFLE